MHIASLVSGAIENAQLYDRERRRVDTLTGLSELAQQVASAPGADELARVLVAGMARLLSADVCQLFGLEPDGETLSLLASIPDELPAPLATSAAELTLAALDGHRGARRSPAAVAVAVGRCRRPAGRAAGGRGERVGLICAASACEQSFGDEDAEIARAVAHLGRGRDQARRADRGVDQGQHDQGPVRGAGGRRDRVRRHQGGRGPLRPDRRPTCWSAPSRRARSTRPRAGGGPPPSGSGHELVAAGAAVGDRGRAGAGPGAAVVGLEPATSAPTSCCSAAVSSASATAPRSGSASGDGAPGDAAAAYREASDAATIAPGAAGRRAARSTTRGSAPTAISSRSAPTTRRATGCGPRSTA